MSRMIDIVTDRLLASNCLMVGLTPFEGPPATLLSPHVRYEKNASRKVKFRKIKRTSKTKNKGGAGLPVTSLPTPSILNDATAVPTVPLAAAPKLRGNVYNQPGAEDQLVPVLATLKTDGLWTGQFDSQHNLKFIQRFVHITRDEKNQRRRVKTRQDSHSYINVTATDIDWWIRYGPLLTPLVKEPQNHKFAIKGAQFRYFVTSILRDRRDARSVDEYETAAAKLGVAAWSGILVWRIIELACKAQNQDFPDISVNESNTNQVQLILPETLKAVRDTIYTIIPRRDLTSSNVQETTCTVIARRDLKSSNAHENTPWIVASGVKGKEGELVTNTERKSVVGQAPPATSKQTKELATKRLSDTESLKTTQEVLNTSVNGESIFTIKHPATTLKTLSKDNEMTSLMTPTRDGEAVNKSTHPPLNTVISVKSSKAPPSDKVVPEDNPKKSGKRPSTARTPTRSRNKKAKSHVSPVKPKIRTLWDWVQKE